MRTTTWLARCRTSVLAIALCAAGSAWAQTPASAAPSQPPAARVPVPVADAPARPEDVSSIDGIVKAFYDVISGPAGQPRQWARDRTLYIPGVRFVAMSVDQEGKPLPDITTHQEYVDQSDAGLVAKGFYEVEIHRVTKRFGNIAHVFSAYEVRRTKDGPAAGRGVNSMELFWDGTRWWIASAIWETERKDNPIPKDLLP